MDNEEERKTREREWWVGKGGRCRRRERWGEIKTEEGGGRGRGWRRRRDRIGKGGREERRGRKTEGEREKSKSKSKHIYQYGPRALIKFT